MLFDNLMGSLTDTASKSIGTSSLRLDYLDDVVRGAATDVDPLKEMTESEYDRFKIHVHMLTAVVQILSKDARTNERAVNATKEVEAWMNAYLATPPWIPMVGKSALNQNASFMTSTHWRYLHTAFGNLETLKAIHLFVDFVSAGKSKTNSASRGLKNQAAMPHHSATETAALRTKTEQCFARVQSRAKELQVDIRLHSAITDLVFDRAATDRAFKGTPYLEYGETWPSDSDNSDLETLGIFNRKVKALEPPNFQWSQAFVEQLREKGLPVDEEMEQAWQIKENYHTGKEDLVQPLSGDLSVGKELQAMVGEYATHTFVEKLVASWVDALEGVTRVPLR